MPTDYPLTFPVTGNNIVFLQPKSGKEQGRNTIKKITNLQINFPFHLYVLFAYG